MSGWQGFSNDTGNNSHKKKNNETTLRKYPMSHSMRVISSPCGIADVEYVVLRCRWSEILWNHVKSKLADASCPK